MQPKPLCQSANSVSSLRRISSRTRMNSAITSASEPVACAGSSNGQCLCSTAAGKVGQFSAAEEQTPMIRSGTCPSGGRKVEMSLLTCDEISMPAWRMAATAFGWTKPAGFVPADNDWNRSPCECRRNPSAIWLRQELPVHKNRTRLR